MEEAKNNESNLNQYPKKDGGDILKSFPKRKVKTNTLFLVVASLVVVLAGVGTGWLLSGKSSGKVTESGQKDSSSVTQKSDTEAGVNDTSAFPQEAEGMLVEGGIENDGTHHLERPGGVSQNVYLTSTVIDLQSFVGKKVKIWGETISGQKAGWLMDVGKIKVIE